MQSTAYPEVLKLLKGVEEKHKNQHRMYKQREMEIFSFLCGFVGFLFVLAMRHVGS